MFAIRSLWTLDKWGNVGHISHDARVWAVFRPIDVAQPTGVVRLVPR